MSKKKGVSRKKGTAFELVVRDISKAISPASIVLHGKWLNGPDGRRDCDVYINSTINGKPNKLLIECKDYKKPVGVSFIDALDSKRHDLDIDGAIICSNSGFTKAALSKAERKGIGLIAVLKSGDTRIRYKLLDNIYIRHVKALTVKMGFGLLKFQQLNEDSIIHATFQGLPILNWVYKQVELLMKYNIFVKGDIQHSQRLVKPITIQTRQGDLEITSINFQTTITGCWLQQKLELDSSGAIYNWLSKSIKISPNGKTTFSHKGINFYEGLIVKSVPQSQLDLLKPNKLSPGERTLSWTMMTKIVDDNDVPDLLEHIHEEDRSPIIDDLISENFTSDMSFQIDKPDQLICKTNPM